MNTQTFSLEQLVGKNLQGYVVHQLLRSGKLSAVYMAQQALLRSVLLTAFLLPTDLSAEAHACFRQRFMETASKLALLDHPHILPLYAYGEEYGYPYLVTPSLATTTSSLAQLLQQQGPFTPEQTLELFQQIAAALDYARLQGMTHGSLEAAHILLDREQNVQLTNFGLMHMLSLHGIEENERPYAHLFSLAGTFLGAPEYMAPEVVEGKTPDERSDVYALGILLYELLSGTLPFTGEDPMAIAFAHVDQSVPPLHLLPPSLAAALDRVIQQSLGQDPARRYQTAGKLVAALEQALQDREQVALAPPPAQPARPFSLPQKKIIATEVEPHEQTGERRGLLSGATTWQKTAPSSAPEAAGESGGWQLRPPIITDQMAAIKIATGPQVVPGEYPRLPAAALLEEQPVRAVPAPALPSIVDQNTLPGTMPDTYRPALPETPLPDSMDKGRRKTLAVLATGAVVALGVFGLGGISLVRLAQGQPAPTSAASGGRALTLAAQQKSSIIGRKSQPLNSAVKFTNPADRQASLLIHLPDGKFVAYESACTHEAVAVVYDPKRHLLVCPRHNSIFDPAAGGKALSGPATAPLKPVRIQIHADGSISAV